MVLGGNKLTRTLQVPGQGLCSGPCSRTQGWESPRSHHCPMCLDPVVPGASQRTISFAVNTQGGPACRRLPQRLWRLFGQLGASSPARHESCPSPCCALGSSPFGELISSGGISVSFPLKSIPNVNCSFHEPTGCPVPTAILWSLGHIAGHIGSLETPGFPSAWPGRLF